MVSSHRSILRVLCMASIALSGAFACGQVFAGTIRDDRDDALYTAFAAQQQFRASGYLGIRQGDASAGVASGTLVAPQWILTAGHCVITEQGLSGDNWTFQIESQIVTIPPENVFFPASWVTSGFDSGHDVALMRLPQPLIGIRPAALSAATDELGKLIATVGYGTTGTGITGNTGAPGTRRAGQNTFDATATSIVLPGYNLPPYPVGSERTLLYDFDNPQGTSNTLGSPNPLNLEYSGAPGDSGGGAFLFSASGARIVGVVSAGISPNGLEQSSYGTTAIYARVSANLPWIRSAIAGRELPLPTLVNQILQGGLQRAATASSSRRAELSRRGFSLYRLVGRVTRPDMGIELHGLFEIPAASGDGSVLDVEKTLLSPFFTR